MKKSDNIDSLLEKIDNELIKLYDSPDMGVYKVYDFKTALNVLRQEMKRYECSEYHKEKISYLVSVFNDLCNTTVETIYYRDISYDKNTHIAETEETYYNGITGEHKITTHKREVSLELWNHFSTKTLPDNLAEKLNEVCKYDYWLKNSQLDYFSFFPAVQHNYNGKIENDDDMVSYIYIMDEIIQKGNKFDDYFSIDINYLWKHKATFEQYVYNLKKQNALDESAVIRDNSPIYLSNDKGKKIDYIRVINCLFELGFFKDEQGNKILKKTVMEKFGTLVNIDLSNYDKDLSSTRASANSDGKSLLRIFNAMLDKQKELNNI